MRRLPTCTFPVLLSLALLAHACTAAPVHAWTLDGTLVPEPYSLSIDHRTRYERIDPGFRPGESGRGDGFFLRTLVHGTVRPHERFTLGAELLDGRSLGADDTRLTTSTTNAVELLQAYVSMEHDLSAGTLHARAGRLTMDVGSRRLVSRNRFRNTINGFTGVDAVFRHADGWSLRGFWTMPLQRLPDARERIEDNEIELDQENLDAQFFGLIATRPLDAATRLEIYAFGIHEDATAGSGRRRRFVTPGFRLVRDPGPGRVDFEVESVGQAGRSRRGAGTADLDHRAFFQHVSAGYTLAAPWQPRLVLEYDYASGDDDPDDGDQGRFDTLFGSRRSELGPTGIYGPFARGNLHTPGLHVALRPADPLLLVAAYRGFWLASKRDAWVGTGLSDPSGRSGSFLGSQFEIRGRWTVLPGSTDLEVGYAHLFSGGYLDEVPDATHRGDVDYFYAQVSLRV